MSIESAVTLVTPLASRLAKPTLSLYNRARMDERRIAELLQPFLTAPIPEQENGETRVLNERQVQQFSAYLDLLLRWNARVNLTAVRDAENIVTRHFGESLFAARCLFAPTTGEQRSAAEICLIDFGSGAGFPGLPIKIWSPQLRVILLESNNKKATFLREVIRALGLGDVEVISDRAENYRGAPGDVVTFRAVERFEASLMIATRLVRPGGRLAILVGENQALKSKELISDFHWADPIRLPLSLNRVVLIGSQSTNQVG